MAGGADQIVGDLIGVTFVADEDVVFDSSLGLDQLPLLLTELGDDKFLNRLVYHAVHCLGQ